MRFTTFQEEDSLEAIAERSYSRLSVESREKAITALVKANPNLNDLNTIQPGTLLVIPDLEGADTKETGTEGPADQITEFLVERLDEYEKNLVAGYESLQSDLKSQLAVLKDKKLIQMIKTSPEAETFAKQVDKTIKSEEKSATQVQKRLITAVKKLRSDLSER